MLVKMVDIEYMCEMRKFNIKGNCYSFNINIYIFKNNLILFVRNKFWVLWNMFGILLRFVWGLDYVVWVCYVGFECVLYWYR